mmetsp:Transcript_14786/g.25154  ORF Transcript_14786/g.25154 Transcript_14786/m.25154 type:complete len:138 (+) Transcript_14786:207-620(+)
MKVVIDEVLFTTPQYLPPEIHKHLSLSQNGPKQNQHGQVQHVWSLDMWSLGILALELAIGFSLDTMISSLSRKEKGNGGAEGMRRGKWAACISKETLDLQKYFIGDLFDRLKFYAKVQSRSSVSNNLQLINLLEQML